MKLSHTDHIGINTLDINGSVKFYQDLFGFRVIEEADMGDKTLVYMENETGIRIELFDLRGNTIEGERPEDLQGFRHIAFYVEDIKAWDERLKAAGAEYTLELTRMPEIKRDGLLIKDPNGFIIELTSEY